MNVKISLLFFVTLGLYATAQNFGVIRPKLSKHSAVVNDYTSGVNLAFQEINQAGGVHGNNLNLITFDEPEAGENFSTDMNALLGGSHLFGLIGAYGRY
jgi:ABC-type branched-subunit amino acid transport system substrate-binding protein